MHFLEPHILTLPMKRKVTVSTACAFPLVLTSEPCGRHDSVLELFDENVLAPVDDLPGTQIVDLGTGSGSAPRLKIEY
jgi:hypothetical protein